MDNSCNCAHCPHSCGDKEEIEKNDDEQISEESSDDTSSEKEPAVVKATTTRKVEKLKQAILNLGFKLEDTEKGIRVTM